MLLALALLLALLFYAPQPNNGSTGHAAATQQGGIVYGLIVVFSVMTLMTLIIYPLFRSVLLFRIANLDQLLSSDSEAANDAKARREAANANLTYRLGEFLFLAVLMRLFMPRTLRVARHLGAVRNRVPGGETRLAVGQVT
ncbi:MAG: hypothetical protein ACRETL_02175 [Gammaproteobacteria bacterium]